MELPVACIVIGVAAIALAFVIRSHRGRSPCLTAGFLLLACGIVFGGLHLTKPAGQQSSARLLHAFCQGDPIDGQVHVESLERLRNAELTDSETAELVEHLLDLQAGEGHAWSSAYGDAIISAHDQGRVSDEQWRRFLEQAVQVDIEQPAQAPLGLPPMLEWSVRITGPQQPARLIYRCTHDETTIDDRPHWTEVSFFMHSLAYQGVTRFMPIDLCMIQGRKPVSFESLTFSDQSEFAATEYGEYDLVSRWTLEVLDLGPDLPAIVTQDAYVFAAPEAQWRMLLKETGREPVKWTQTIEQTVEIKPLDEPETVSDDETRESIRGYLERGIRSELGGADDSDPKLEMGPNAEQFHPDDLPGLGVCDLYFDVFVVIDDTEHYLGPIHQHVTPAPHRMLDVRRKIFLRGRLFELRRTVRALHTADVILRSNDIAPHVWTGAQPLFKGEFRFKDVRLAR